MERFVRQPLTKKLHTHLHYEGGKAEVICITFRQIASAPMLKSNSKASQ